MVWFTNTIAHTINDKSFFCNRCNNIILYNEAIKYKYKHRNSLLTHFQCPICKAKTYLTFIKEPGSVWYYGGKTKVEIIKVKSEMVDIKVIIGNNVHEKGKLLCVKICTLQAMKIR